MKTRRHARLLLAASLLLAACQKEAGSPDNTPELRPLTTAERQTLGSANDFAYRAFGSLRQAAPQRNMFISPLSISAALTMAYNGADGSTKTAMKNTLGFQALGDTAINEAYQSLFALLGGIDRRVTFTVANSLWYAPQVQLQPAFVQTNQRYFDATVQSAPFGNPAAANSINSWVASKTRGLIPSIVDATSTDDVLYLVNALYFKGSWTHRFDPSLTAPGTFRREDGSSSPATFMTLRRGQYQYYRDAQQAVIDLPYGNGQFSMTLVVPQDTATLAGVAGRLTNARLDAWLAAADTSSLELHMPKFSLSYEEVLNSMLRQLGMGEAFSGQANFGRMLPGGGVSISEVRHKAVLKVDEEGSEAAAVTSVGMVTTSLPPSVWVNRPFVFLIREKSSNAILFMGQLVQP